jgi:hypothetical protein
MPILKNLFTNVCEFDCTYYEHRGWFERWTHAGRAMEAATPEEAVQKAEAFLRSGSFAL